MSEKPILFSGGMVRAILDGRKTQTRRVVALREFGASTTPGYDFEWRDRRALWNSAVASRMQDFCPYGAPGDLLWVKETWRALSALPGGEGCETDSAEIGYRADESLSWRGILGEHLGPDEIEAWCARWVRRTNGGWQPSIYMPRWASRLTLRVESVRVERLNEITSGDIWREGLPPGSDGHFPSMREQEATLRESFVRLWDSINSKRAPWASNPWVWVVTFSRVFPLTPALAEEVERLREDLALAQGGIEAIDATALGAIAEAKRLQAVMTCGHPGACMAHDEERGAYCAWCHDEGEARAEVERLRERERVLAGLLREARGYVLLAALASRDRVTSGALVGRIDAALAGGAS